MFLLRQKFMIWKIIVEQIYENKFLGRGAIPSCQKSRVWWNPQSHPLREIIQRPDPHSSSEIRVWHSPLPKK